MSEPKTREIYHAQEGFLVYSDIGHQTALDIESIPVYQIEHVVRSDNEAIEFLLPSSALGLYLAQKHLVGSLVPRYQHLTAGENEQYYTDSAEPLIRRDYRMTEGEATDAKKFAMFQAGIGDMDFSWHFAAAMANVWALECVASGFMTQKKYESLQLSDWADIIGSQPFSDLIHKMAYTANGVYASTGQYPYQYLPGGFKLHVEKALDMEFINPLFRVTDGYDGFSDSPMPVVTLEPEFKSALHQAEWNDFQPNNRCPVARRRITLPNDLVELNPRARALIDRGDLLVDRESPDEEKTVFKIPVTPIDRILRVIATKIREYGDMYGEPSLLWYADASNQVHQFNVTHDRHIREKLEEQICENL